MRRSGKIVGYINAVNTANEKVEALQSRVSNLSGQIDDVGTKVDWSGHQARRNRYQDRQSPAVRYGIQMPKGPKGQKRPADVIGNAIKVARIATGEDTDDVADDGKDKAAQELGRKGGKARAEALSKADRTKIARAAAAARWRKEP
jgi:hypothetical protein